MPNDQEPCLIWEASGIDQDKDGVDDACDGFVGQPLALADQVYDSNEGDGDKYSPGSNSDINDRHISFQSLSETAPNLLGVPTAQSQGLLVASSSPGRQLEQSHDVVLSEKVSYHDTAENEDGKAAEIMANSNTHNLHLVVGVASIILTTLALTVGLHLHRTKITKKRVQ